MDHVVRIAIAISLGLLPALLLAVDARAHEGMIDGGMLSLAGSCDATSWDQLSCDVCPSSAGSGSAGSCRCSSCRRIRSASEFHESEDDYERSALFHAYAIQNNLISPLWFSLRAARQMLQQDGTASIVNISSGASHPAGAPTLVSYGAAKSGMNHMTKSLAQEWGPKIRVNCLALGPTLTDNFRNFVLGKEDHFGGIRRLQRAAAGWSETMEDSWRRKPGEKKNDFYIPMCL